MNSQWVLVIVLVPLELPQTMEKCLCFVFPESNISYISLAINKTSSSTFLFAPHSDLI